MAQKAKQVKLVQVLARIQYKRNPKAVVYICRSSNGKDQYRTTIYDGKATGCDCPATKPCYHMTGCEAKEQARRYDVVGEAVKVYNRAVADAMIGDSYEVRAEQIAQQQRETDRFYYELATGYNSVPGMY